MYTLPWDGTHQLWTPYLVMEHTNYGHTTLGWNTPWTTYLGMEHTNWQLQYGHPTLGKDRTLGWNMQWQELQAREGKPDTPGQWMEQGSIVFLCTNDRLRSLLQVKAHLGS